VNRARTVGLAGVARDSSAAEYFYGANPGGKPRFLEPPVGRFSLCLRKLRPSRHNKSRKKPLAKHFRRKTKFARMIVLFFKSFT
jgi:hypothetical protein